MLSKQSQRLVNEAIRLKERPAIYHMESIKINDDLIVNVYEKYAGTQIATNQLAEYFVGVSPHGRFIGSFDGTSLSPLHDELSKWDNIRGLTFVDDGALIPLPEISGELDNIANVLANHPSKVFAEK